MTLTVSRAKLAVTILCNLNYLATIAWLSGFIAYSIITTGAVTWQIGLLVVFNVLTAAAWLLPVQRRVFEEQSISMDEARQKGSSLLSFTLSRLPGLFCRMALCTTVCWALGLQEMLIACSGLIVLSFAFSILTYPFAKVIADGAGRECEGLLPENAKDTSHDTVSAGTENDNHKADKEARSAGAFDNPGFNHTDSLNKDAPDSTLHATAQTTYSAEDAQHGRACCSR